MNTDCPSQEELSDFAEGRLSEDRLTQVAEHLNNCSLCESALQKAAVGVSPLAAWLRKSLNSDATNPPDTAGQRETPTPAQFDTAFDTGDVFDSAASPAVDVSERYEILNEVGAGGIGRVFRVYDRQLERELAVKVLREKHVGCRQVENRFMREAVVTAGLEHPGIVPVHEMGRYSDGRPFFAMKLVQGHTLDQLIQSSAEQPTVTDLLQIFKDVCEAVAFAHSVDIVHRDIKAINVMVGEFGTVQVMDWGFAKQLRSDSVEPVFDGATTQARTHDSSVHSTAGLVIGTVSNMPPEQAAGQQERVGKQSDVFALGGLLVEMLTGRPLYDDGEPAATLRQATSGCVDPAIERMRQRTVPIEIMRLAEDCLRFEPQERPTDASVVSVRVADYLASLEQRERASEITRAEEKVTATHVRRNRVLTSAISVVTLCAFAIGGGWWWHTKSRRAAFAASETQRVETFLDRLEVALSHLDVSPLSDTQFAVASEAKRNAEASLGFVRDHQLSSRHKSLSVRLAIAKRQAELVDRLEELRNSSAFINPTKGQTDWSARRAAHRMALEDLGLTTAQSPSEAIAYVETYPEYLRELLITAIDTFRQTDPESQDFWFAVVDEADLNEERRSLRRQLHEGTDPSSLVASFDASAAGPDTALMLADQFDLLTEPQQAITVLEKAVSCAPENFWLNYSLANSLPYAKPARYADAVRYANAAVSANPRNVSALLLLASAARNNNDIDTALTACERAIVADPEGHQGLLHKAAILYEAEQLPEALETIEKALSIQSEPNGLDVYGQILSRLGRSDEALKQHELAAKKRNSASVDSVAIAITYLNRADRTKSTADLREAQRYLEQARQSEPRSRDAIVLYAQSLQMQAQLTDSNTARKELHNRAIELLEPVLNNDHPRAHLALLDSLGELNDRERGDKVMTAMRETHRLRAFEWIRVADYYKKTRNTSAAIDALEQASQDASSSAKQATDIAVRLHELGAHEAAVALCQSALSSNPTHLDLLEVKAHSLAKLADWNRVRETREQIDALTTDDTKDRVYGLLVAYLELNLHREASETVKRLITLEPQVARWHYVRGNTLSRQKRFYEAMESYVQCLDRDPNYIEAMINLADADQEVGLLDDATKQLNAAEQSKEATKWRDQIDLCRAKISYAKTWQKQIPKFKDGTFEPTSFDQWLSLAQISQRFGHHEIATKAYQELIDRDQSRADYMSLSYFQARSLVAAGKSSGTNEADRTKNFEKAVALVRHQFEERKRAADEANQHRAFALYLRNWLDDPALSVTRGLTSEEPSATRWKQLWQDVEREFDIRWRRF